MKNLFSKRPFVVNGKEVHLIQGGMAFGISGPVLASTVANASFLNPGDCVGTIAASLIGINDPNYIRNPEQVAIKAFQEAIREFRRKSNGILAVNIMVAMNNFDTLMRVAIEEAVDIIFVGAGITKDAPKYLKRNGKTMLIPIVSSGRVAAFFCKTWWKKYNYLVPAFVVEGAEAGGHLGPTLQQINDSNFSLEILVNEVMDAIRPFEGERGIVIPIFPAGGVCNASRMNALLKLGVTGFQIGSLLGATREGDAADGFKWRYIEAKEEDVIIIISPVGMPGRAFKSPLLEKVMNGEKLAFTCPFHCLKPCNPKKSPYCIARALLNAQLGDVENGFVFTGAQGWRINEILTVEEVLRNLQDGLIV